MADAEIGTQHVRCRSVESSIASALAVVWNGIAAAMCFTFAAPLLVLLSLAVALQECRIGFCRLWLILTGRRNQLGRPLSGGDAYWAAGLTQSAGNIAVLMHLKGEVYDGAVNELDRFFINAVDDAGNKVFPKFTQIIKRIGGQYVWLEYKDYNVQDHVTFHRVLLDGADDTDQILRLCSKIHCKPFRKDRPQWDFNFFFPVMENGRKPDFVYAYLRVQHAIADGVTLMKGVALVASREATPEQLKAMIVKLPHRPALNWWKKALLNIQIVFSAPWFIVQWFLHSESNGLNGPSLEGDVHLCMSKPILLRRIKAVKPISGASVNDVITSCIAGGVRRHLLRTDPCFSQKEASVSAVIPVSLHAFEEGLSSKSMKNKISIIQIPLSVSEDNALSRLQATKRSYRQQYGQHVRFFFCLKYKQLVNHLPGWLSNFLFAGSPATMAISNMPGPLIPITFFGFGVQTIAFFTPSIGRQGINFTAMSYNGKVRFGVTVDKALVHDRQTARRILEYCEEELQELETILKTAPQR